MASPSVTLRGKSLLVWGLYRYGLIGNCHIFAHIHKSGSVAWLCLPRPDSDPVFGRLLDPDGGYFAISSPTGSAQVKTTPRYLPNTNILVTEVSTSKDVLGQTHRADACGAVLDEPLRMNSGRHRAHPDENGSADDTDVFGVTLIQIVTTITSTRIAFPESVETLDPEPFSRFRVKRGGR